MKPTARTIAGAAIVLAIVAAAAWAPRAARRREAPPPARGWVVRRAALGLALHERGRLVSLSTAPLEAGAPGELIEVARGGTRVRAGDVVARLDVASLQDRLDDQEANLQTHLTERETETAEREFACVQETNNLFLAAHRLALAESRLASARAEPRPEERRLLEIAIELAELDLREAEEDLAREQRLLEKGFVTRMGLEPRQRRAETARAALAEKRIALAEAADGRPREELLELESEVGRLREQVARGERSMARRLEEADSRIRESDTEIAKDRFTIANLSREIARTEIRAPTNGVIALRIFQDWRSGGQWSEYKPGITVYKNDRVGDIVNPGLMEVALMVNEADARLVRAGQKARLRLPAYPDREFAGVVRDVGGIGRDRYDLAPRGQEDGLTGVAMFNVTVSIRDPHVEYRPGMSVLVEIEIEPPGEALVVPAEALTPEGGGWVARVRTGRGERRAAVTGRRVGERFFRIESGLNEGDVVCLAADGGGS
jgi:multidrug resistance efflux pump